MNRFKRLIALLLCIATMLSLMGNGVPTALGEAAAVEAVEVTPAPEVVTAVEEAAEASCDYCTVTVAEDGTVTHEETCVAEYVYDGTADVGKYAVLNPDAADYVIGVSDGTDFYDYMTFYYDEFDADLVMKITDWYWDAELTGLWYKVEAYEGAFPASCEDFTWPETAWILQGYTNESSVSTLNFVTIEEPEDDCDICGEAGCTKVHVYCEQCGKYDCGLTHVYCYICGTMDCTTEHVYCTTCGKYDCGVEHEDIYTPATAPVIPDSVTLPEGEVHVVADKDGNAVVGSFELNVGKKSSLSAWSKFDSDETVTDVSYKWQVRYDAFNDLWTDIRGQQGKGVLMSPAMFLPLMNDGITPAIRSVVTANGETLTGTPIEITLDTTTAASSYTAPVALDLADEEVAGKINLVVEYKFANNTIAANSWTAELASGDALKQTVNLPVIAGYVPTFADTDEVSLVNTDGIYTLEINYPAGMLTQTTMLTVTYQPARVNVTILHFWQNSDNDNYTLHEEQDLELLTGDEVGNVHKTYPGFYHLLYEKPVVAADGSTVVEVYYDRYYYLMKFDLGEDGYGVYPVYDRYGSTIEAVGTPTRAGYQFLYWDLKTIDVDGDGDYDQGDNQKDDVPNTVPAENREYVAVWKALDTEYTVVYWVKDNNSNIYSFSASRVVSASSGDEVDGVDDYSTADVCGTALHTHGAECYLCGDANHAHTASCFVCGIDSHVTQIDQAELTCGHVHTTACLEANINQQNPTTQDLAAFAAIGDGEPESGYVYTINASRDSDTYYYLYIDNVWYYIRNNNKWISGDQLGEGTYEDWQTYTARKYNVNLECGHIHNGSCTHAAECFSCGEEVHVHGASCKSDIAQYMNFVEADQDVIVQGDGSTVVNVYYEYRTYTIRFIYAKKNGEYYQIATLTRDGRLNNCQWTNINSTTLPTFKDPNGKTERSSVVIDGETYYYISLTAKYGADISSVWPSANIGNAGDYEWGSWGAGAGTGYRIKYGDEHANIVGTYPTMSADMILDNQVYLSEEEGYLAQNMIAWWGNNQGIALHAYHNYFELLPGEVEVEGNTYETYGNKRYKLVETYTFTAAHNGDTRVDPIYYNGFICVNDSRNTANDTQANSSNFSNGGNCTLCVVDCNYHNKFYYEREKHKLYFWNHNGYLQDGTGADLVYGESLEKYGAYVSDAFMGESENYPNNLEPGVYRFAGWYTTSECLDGTEIDWTITMPDSDMTVYAKWVPITHTVRFFLDKEDYTNQIIIPNRLNKEPYKSEFESKTISHNAFLLGVDTPEVAEGDEAIHAYSQYDFNGWYYLENGVEKRFVAGEDGMPVTSDLDLYAKWSSNVLRGYTVYFALGEKDEKGNITVKRDTDGNIIYVADPITGSSLAGNSKTFDAKGGTALYTDYQSRYYPNVASHTITLSINDEDHQGDNTFTFLYIPSDYVPYTVKYLAKGTNEVLAPEKTVADNTKAVVTENFVPVSGYMPDAYQKTHVVTVDGDNEIIFWYEIDTVNALYQINHYTLNLDGKTWTLYDTYTRTGQINNNYTATPVTINGFTFSEDVTNGYNVTDKKNGATGVDLPGGEGYEIKAFANNVIEGKLSPNGMQLNLYYTRNSYPYEVHYLEYGTNDVLIASENGTAFFGAYLSKTAPPVIATTDEGEEFELYSTPGSQAMTIVKDGENGGLVEHNVLTFYYKRCTQSLTVNKTMTGEGADTDLVFNFTVTIDSDYEYHQESYAYTKGAESGYLYPANGVISFTLKHGESITIADLPTAEYTVAETSMPLGYYSDFDAATVGDQENTHFILNKENAASVTCTNTYAPANLTIRKEVYEVQSATNVTPLDKFEFTITFPENVTPEASYDYTVSGTEGTQTANVNGRAMVIELEDGQTATFLNLPVGQYTVTETDYTAQAYNSYSRLKRTDWTEATSWVEGVACQPELVRGETTAAEYANLFPVGDLEISKTVSKEFFKDAWNGDTFTFTVDRWNEENGSNTETVLVNGNTYNLYLDDSTQATGTVTVADNQLVVEIKFTGSAEDTEDPEFKTDAEKLMIDGETVTHKLLIKNLPAGIYRVVEDEDTAYTQTPVDRTVSEIQVPKPVDADAATTATAAFTNVLKRHYGRLEITKDVALIGTGVENPDPDKTKLFDITVNLIGDPNFSGTVNVAYSPPVDGDTRPVIVQAANGSFTIQLKEDEVATITQVPAVGFTVTEANYEDYDEVITLPEGVKVNDVWTIDPTTTAKVLVTNEYPVKLGTLTIVKTINNEDNVPEGEKQSFLFHIKGTNNDVDMDVVINGAGEVTISEMPLGSYTVTEDTAWSWRYDCAEPVKTATITVNDVNQTVTFQNTYTESKWLTELVTVVNKFTQTSTTTPAE